MGRPRTSETYRAVHKRLQTDRGRAANFACTCGKPAREWAYQYGAVNERVEGGRRYSLDLADYEPMCARCHRLHDHANDPERHQRKNEAARQRMIALNQDPDRHEQRVEASRKAGRASIAARREAGTLAEFTSMGGKARRETDRKKD